MRVMFRLMLIVGVLVPSALAKTRAVGAPDHELVTFTVSMPAAERLSTGLGLGVLYDPELLRFVRVNDAAPDVFRFSAAPELVEDPPRVAGRTALLRLTWLNFAGTWAPAQSGGTIASLQFERLTQTNAEIRVVPLAADETHAVRSTWATVRPGLTLLRTELDPRIPERFSRAVGMLALPAGQCTPDVDGNGVLDALTDGVLLLRYLFGVTGADLIRNAVGSNATRTTASAIATFLAQSDCVVMLDVDQSNRADALTDGVLFARYLFGFSEDDLTAGALASDARRTAAAAFDTVIQAYSLPRSTVLSTVSIASGATVTDPAGEFEITAVGGDAVVTLVQGTDYSGDRTLDLSKSGTGDLSVVLPPAPAGPPASVPATTVTAFRRIGTLAQDEDVSYTWTVQEFAKRYFFTCGANNRLPESVQGAERPQLPSSLCNTRFNWLHWEQHRPAILKSQCKETDGDCLNRPPVLLVHGFQPFQTVVTSDYGGGEGTWDRLPALIKAQGRAAFEFQWITAARFDDVAVDLAAAIREVAWATGRQVHIVAHSFGGLLVRTLLQSPEGSAVEPYIADVVSLGTPHSGIALASCANSSVPIPLGADNSMLEDCKQISCYQAGFDSLQNIYDDDDHFTGATRSSLQSVYSLTGAAGYLITQLSDASSFPNIDWLALMGLVTRTVGTDTFGTGDDLITYQGQRFFPSMSVSSSCSAVTPPGLSTGKVIGDGRLWERVLGFTGQPLPGQALTTPTDSAFKDGYIHNGFSAVKYPADLVARREAAVDCDDAATCKHDTYLYLFGTDTTHSFFSPQSWFAAHEGNPLACQIATFSGTVVDSVTHQPIVGANVQILFGSSGPSILTDSIGRFSLDVPFERTTTYRLRISATNYYSQDTPFTSAGTLDATVKELGTKYLVAVSSAGYGTLSGTVQNATTGTGISGAYVTVRRSDRGTTVYTGWTSSNGRYDAGSRPAGTYIVSASAAGFIDGGSEVAVSANTSNTANVPLSPQLANGQARIVLTWGVDPSDLDSHLVKYTSAGTTEYHVYYGHRAGTNGDNLDVDDITSYGPETVTIQNVDPSARYRYWVHLFAGYGTIAASPARVTVTYNDATLTFNAPASATGRDWIVFDIVNGQIVPCSGSCSVAPYATAAATK